MIMFEIEHDDADEFRYSRPEPKYFIWVDEPGVGMCDTAHSFEEAQRKVMKWRKEGYNAKFRNRQKGESQ